MWLCKLVLCCFHSHFLFTLLNAWFFLSFYMLIICLHFTFLPQLQKLYCCAFSATVMRPGYCNLQCSEGILLFTGYNPQQERLKILLHNSEIIPTCSAVFISSPVFTFPGRQPKSILKRMRERIGSSGLCSSSSV